MAIAPSTNLYLLKVPIEIDNKNQLTFANKQAQFNYFSSLENLYVDRITYQRHDSVIRYPAHIDSILDFNYCMYQNSNYSNKWFYAFITGMTYLNDNMTLIQIKTDVWQTWCFDLEFKQSFIEREHVNDDTIGLHTIDEGLETGDLISNAIFKTDYSNAHVVLATTYDVDRETYYPTRKYGNVDSGLIYYLCGDFTGSVTGLSGLIDKITNNTDTNAIVSIFMVPDALSGYDEHATDWSYVYPGGLSYAPYKKIPETTIATILETITLTRPSSFGSYTPKNNKLLCFPYNYLLCDNNNGENALYKYEYFNENFSFIVNGVITPGCSIRLLPLNYKGVENNNIEGLNSGKFPICSWQTDTYTNWLTQNSINVAGITISRDDTNLISSVAGIGNVENISGGVGVLSNITNSLITKKQHQIVPNQANGNINNGDVTFAMGNTDFTFYKMQMREEYARICDNYLSMFGYKVNTVKTPNIFGRQNWNFVKTIGANIHGFIPQNDMQEIKNMFDAGVTFWHNTNTFLDYTQSNSII